MKLWIIGAKGFLGSALAQACVNKNLEFIATGKEDVNITDLEQLKKILQTYEGVTHIVNCAALTDLELAEKDPAQAFLVNATGAENVGIVAQAMNVKVIHISTDYVFDGELNRPYQESDECAPINVYAQSKWEGEKKLLRVCPSACVIRSSWLFGKGGKNFISSVFQKMQTDSVLKIVTDQRGRPTFVKDLADAILRLLSHSGIYHFANQGVVSRFDIAQEIFNQARTLNLKMVCQNLIPITSDVFPTLAKRPSYSVLNTKKVESVLKTPPRDWKEALHEYLCAIKTS